jgi:hypothetical protein
MNWAVLILSNVVTLLVTALVCIAGRARWKKFRGKVKRKLGTQTRRITANAAPRVLDAVQTREWIWKGLLGKKDPDYNVMEYDQDAHGNKVGDGRPHRVLPK